METWPETFAMLALLLGITSSGPEWYTTSNIDPIDDTRSAIALRLERPGQWTRAGRHRLLLLFCEERRPNERPDLHAVVAWNMSAEDLSKPVDENRQGESRTTMGILTRFGDEQARSWTYERVGKGNELFTTIPHDMDRFLKEAKRATEVALRLEHDVKGTQTTVFDLTGSARVIKSMESGCNPPSQPRTPLSARRQEAAPTPSSPPPPSAPTQRSRGAQSEEGALASLPVDDRAWIESSCSADLDLVELRTTRNRSGAARNAEYLRSDCSRSGMDRVELLTSSRAGDLVELRTTRSRSVEARNAGYLRSGCSQSGMDRVELLTPSRTGNLVELRTTRSRSDPRHATSLACA